VFRVIGASPEIEDIVQDVFIHVFRSVHRFRGESKFTTWLYRLTVNVTKMHLRRKKSRPRLVEALPYTRESPSQAPARPDELAEQQVRITALRELVAGLSDKKRTVLILHDFEGMPPAEIAKVVEAPVLTVRTRLFYARKELYAAIAQHPILAASIEHLMQQLPGGSKTQRDSAESKP
jgi:RNA polymerase sigma-70 factor (ECF subfamily)